MSPDAATRRQALVAFLLYLAFVVYGSLVPFEYRALTWDQAVANFQHIEYLELGVVGRADWIANIVLYVPLAFRGCLVLLGRRRVGWLAQLGRRPGGCVLSRDGGGCGVPPAVVCSANGLR